MTTLTLGTALATGKPLAIDLDVLIRTRLLITANSGGGKSWLLRRFAEQLFGKVPVIIIDPEGEFASLRERYGYVLVGKGGETPADTRSAALVAHKLLELRASAVCDLYDLPHLQRHTWVRLFLEALMNAPKRLWHPTIVAVDEVHRYAPERGEGESEALPATIALATDGRKRGFCAAFATQRLSKLSKNASAELLNRLVGPTFEDLDLDRSANLLSILRPERPAFFAEMKVQEPGLFWGLGRAIATTRVLLKVGPVTTTHPEAGSTKHAAEPPPAPEKVRALLPKLADLPKAAEEKAQTETDLRKKVRELQAELKARPTAEVVKGDPKLATKARHLRSALEAVMKFLININVQDLARGLGDGADAAAILKAVEAAVERGFANVKGELEKRNRLLEDLGKRRDGIVTKIKEILEAAENSEATVDVRMNEPFTVAPASRTSTTAPRRAPSPRAEGDSASGDLPKPQRRILIAIAQHGERGVSREQLSVLTGYARSTRDRQLQYLGQSGFVEILTTGDIAATSAGIAALGADYEPLPTGADLREYWLARLPLPQRRILEVLVAQYPDAVERGAISEATGYARSTRDRQIQYLQARRLVTADRGQVRASEELF